MSDFNAEIFNAVNPIVGVEVFDNGVMVVKRKSQLQGSFDCSNEGRKDREIMKFTAKSMSRLVATINATDIQLNSMITLTYPELYPTDGLEVKQDLNRFLTMLRRKHPTEFLWFLEFQKRGAPHYHLLTEHKNITPEMRIAVAENWVGGIARSKWLKMEVARKSLKRGCKCEYDEMRKQLARSYAFTTRKETWELLRSMDGAKRYVTKYAVKEYQKKAPNNYNGVGRFWGCSKGVMLQGSHFVEMDEIRLRKFLEGQDHATKNWDVLPKYLFSVKNT